MPLDRDAQLQRHVRLTRTCRSCRIRYQKGGEAPPSILAAGPRRDRAIEIGGVVVRLAPDRSPALGAQVVVLVAARKDEQEFLASRRRPSASGAEEARGLELLEAVSLRHGEILPRGVPIQAADDRGERVSVSSPRSNTVRAAGARTRRVAVRCRDAAADARVRAAARGSRARATPGRPWAPSFRAAAPGGVPRRS